MLVLFYSVLFFCFSNWETDSIPSGGFIPIVFMFAISFMRHTSSLYLSFSLSGWRVLFNICSFFSTSSVCHHVHVFIWKAHIPMQKYKCDKKDVVYGLVNQTMAHTHTHKMGDRKDVVNNDDNNWNATTNNHWLIVENETYQQLLCEQLSLRIS